MSANRVVGQRWQKVRKHLQMEGPDHHEIAVHNFLDDGRDIVVTLVTAFVEERRDPDARPPQDVLDRARDIACQVTYVIGDAMVKIEFDNLSPLPGQIDSTTVSGHTSRIIMEGR